MSCYKLTSTCMIYFLKLCVKADPPFKSTEWFRDFQKSNKVENQEAVPRSEKFRDEIVDTTPCIVDDTDVNLGVECPNVQLALHAHYHAGLSGHELFS